MTGEDQLKEIAAQLRQPSGDKGLEIAAMMNESNIGMTYNAIKNLHLTDGDTTLELGPGNSAHLEYLLSKSNDLTYHGLDISILMKEQAEQINRQFVASGKAVFTLYDGLNIPLSDNSFTKAFTVNTIYFWQNPLHLLNEIHRVLAPGGKLAISFAHRSFMEQLPFTKFGFKLYNSEDVEELVKRSLLKVVHLDTQTEQVTSKMGEQMDRTFTTLVAEKQ